MFLPYSGGLWQKTFPSLRRVSARMWHQSNESIQLIFVCAAETSRLEGNTKGIVKFMRDPLTCPLKISATLSLKTFELRIAKWSRATENPSQLKERSSAEAEGDGGSEDPAFSPPPPPSHASALPGDFAAAARRGYRRGEEQQFAAVGNGGGLRAQQQQQQQQVFQCSGRNACKEKVL